MATSLAPPRRRQLPALRSRRFLALLDDERLVREVAKGSEPAFEVIYDRHHRGLLSFCRHLLGSLEEAEDALQQTFASAYDHLSRDAGSVRLKPWLYTIARNRCISMIRARHTEPADDLEPSTDGLDQEVQRRADLRQLLADVQRLPFDQRSALILSELRGLSHRDVAEVLECDTRKVKALVFQARTHLLGYRAARDTPCADVRREIAARRRGAPTGAVRRHLAVCEGCTGFRERMREQRRALGLLLPVLPAAGLKSKALAAAGAAGGGSAGAGVSGGAWLAGHAQAIKLASLGAAAVTAAAVTIPLVTGGSRPADAGNSAGPVGTHALWPPAAGGHALPQAAGGLARAWSHPAAAVRHGVAAGSPAHGKRLGVHHRSKARREHRRVHRAHRPQAFAPSHQSNGPRGHAYAYGHLHAPGWIRNHGGEALPPGWRPAHGLRRGRGRRHGP